MIKKCKKCRKVVKGSNKFCSKECFVKFSNPLLGNEKELVRLYKSGHSTIAIGKKFGCHASTCERLLKKIGVTVSQRRYFVNDSYFESIDSAEKAYWLGMLATDGNVAKKVNVVSISIKERDHLEKFRQACSASYKIYTNKKISTLQITSKQMKSDLIKYGITPNKSKVLRPVKLHDFEADFWRGCFDGDGGIALRGKYWRIYYCGTPHMVKGFLSFIKKTTGVEGKKKDISKTFSRMQFDKFSDLKKIISVLYRDNNVISMDRKSKLAHQLLENVTGIDENYLYKKRKMA